MEEEEEAESFKSGRREEEEKRMMQQQQHHFFTAWRQGEQEKAHMINRTQSLSQKPGLEIDPALTTRANCAIPLTF